MHTWAITSQSLLKAETIIVSLSGEQWSPKTAPACTAPTVATSTGLAAQHQYGQRHQRQTVEGAKNCVIHVIDTVV